jgi:hypothetical protein
MNFLPTLQRLAANWCYGGFLAGLLLLGLLPVVARGWPLALVFVYLQLPIYMLHQLEEHDGDRFRMFFNETLGQGREALSKMAVFVINIPGVWGVNLASILLAAFVNLGFGLIGIYLTLVNALAHIGQGFAMRRYNPGLATAILLFLPVGGFGLWTVTAAGHGTWGFQALGLLSAIAIHAAIMRYAFLRARSR